MSLYPSAQASSSITPLGVNVDDIISDDDDGLNCNGIDRQWIFEFQPLCPWKDDHGDDKNNDTRDVSICRSSSKIETRMMILSISIPLNELYTQDVDAYRAIVPQHADAQLENNHSTVATKDRQCDNNSYDDGCDNDDDADAITRQASAARVALSDYTARCLAELLPIHKNNYNNNSHYKENTNEMQTDDTYIIIQTMGQQSRNYYGHRNNTLPSSISAGKRIRGKNKSTKKVMPLPFVLERTDCMIVRTLQPHPYPSQAGSVVDPIDITTTTTAPVTTMALKFYLHATIIPCLASTVSSASPQDMIQTLLSPMLRELHSRLTSPQCFQHVACVVLQRMLRSMLMPPLKSNNYFPAGQQQHHHQQQQQQQQQEEYSRQGNHPPSHLSASRHPKQFLNAIAFIADGSLLPRKSGRSVLPMPSPPSLPFVSPQHPTQVGDEDNSSSTRNNEVSQLTRIVTVNVGKFWRKFLNEDGSTEGTIVPQNYTPTSLTTSTGSNTVTMRGMIIPRGVTLIVGGGYHGKSTLLHQGLVMGVYDTIPGDGRERCVSHEDAVSIRAEDGRYVNNVNISAFISELPKIKWWERSSTLSSSTCSTVSSGTTRTSAPLTSPRPSLSVSDSNEHRSDVTCFGTKDASGSTSQAANVIEAIECGASALLVDEDVSAANFMARDGRMRAMIMNEPITPFLYRVNGLFLSKGISTVVVVGGVGDWLDVADAVILMQDYVAFDGLKKARSVSYQFSYGHVQYAGRGVVHRLPWEATRIPQNEDASGGKSAPLVSTLSPLRRRPESNALHKFNSVAMLDTSSSRLLFYNSEFDENDMNDDRSNAALESFSNNDSNNDDEDEGIVDMAKCSQLIDNSSEQLYGCGICVLWLIRESVRWPGEDLLDLIIRMEYELDCHGGMDRLLLSLEESKDFVPDAAHELTTICGDPLLTSRCVLNLWRTLGYAFRPRRHEVAMALTRMRGITFTTLPEKKEELPVWISQEEEMRILEEESKKRTLAELWENRRRK